LLTPLISKQASFKKRTERGEFLDDPFNEEFFKYLGQYLDEAIEKMKSTIEFRD
jgi:hypothetical protein